MQGIGRRGSLSNHVWRDRGGSRRGGGGVTGTQAGAAGTLWVGTIGVASQPRSASICPLGTQDNSVESAGTVTSWQWQWRFQGAAPWNGKIYNGGGKRTFYRVAPPIADTPAVIAPLLNAPAMQYERHAAIPTWFKVGGGADRFARVSDSGQLLVCLRDDPDLLILGDGANLLVDDDGVDRLVVSLAGLNECRWDISTGLLTVGAGVNLPKLITQTVRDGLGGLEVLAGIPATVGGALVMNAGGAFGQIADVVHRVFAVSREGREIALSRAEIPYSYRHSGLGGLIITGAELRLTLGDPAALRERLKEVMAYKKKSQPMGDNSAGCCFKNPTLGTDVAGIGAAGQRVSAGMVIDKAGCKGMRIRTAEVSEVHGNFLTADEGGKARDVIELMEAVEKRVMERFGMRLEREVVVWRRGMR